MVEEVNIEEHDFIQTVSQENDAQAISEVQDIDVESEKIHEVDEEVHFVNESIKMNDDNLNILAEKENSALEKPDIIIEEDESNTAEKITYSDFEQIDDDVNETCDEELTFDEISIKEDLFIGSGLNFNNIFRFVKLVDDLQYYYNSFSYKSNSERNLNKDSHNENNILEGNWAIIYTESLDNGYAIINLEEDFNNRHIDNFAYSIDNSIIGDESSVIQYALLNNNNSLFDTLNYNEFLNNIELKLYDFLNNKCIPDDEHIFSGSRFVEFYTCNFACERIFSGSGFVEFYTCNFACECIFSGSGFVEFYTCNFACEYNFYEEFCS